MKGGQTLQKKSKTPPALTAEKKPPASKTRSNAQTKWTTAERTATKDKALKQKDSDSLPPRRPKKEAVPSAKPMKRAAVELETEDASDSEDFDDDLAIDMGSDSEADDDTAVDEEEVDTDFTYPGEESEEELLWDDEGKSNKSAQGKPTEKLDDLDESDDYLSGDSLEDSQAEEDYDELFSGSEGEEQDEIEPGYSSDSSTEETTNTVGNIPMEWYDDLPHIGYDRDGRKILRPATKDELDAFLANVDDVDGWRTVTDKLEGKDIVLTDEELDIIRRLQNQQYTDKNYDPYEPLVEFFSSKTMQTPLSAAPEPKSRFIPSKWEAKIVMKIVRAIREGRIISRRSAAPRSQFYDLWGPSGGDAEESERKSNHPMHIPAPKVRLPDHSESYNPPAEYLLTEKERAEWDATDAEDRERNYVPAKHSNLRTVPGYNRFIQERFARCLDLYLCPRVKKNRLNIDPESLIPKLPDARDLEPFPRSLAITYRGHNGRIRCLSLDPSGLWLVTGGDDGDVRMWEVATGRCMQVWKCGEEPIHAVEWCPNKDVWILAAAFDNKVALIVPQEGADPAMITFAEQIARAGFATVTPSTSDSVKVPVAKWSKPTPEEEASGWRAVVGVTRGFVKHLTWHRKGDYFATVAPEANSTAVLVHQLSKHATQAPFRKSKGLVQKVLFHPAKPFLFVATQRYIRVYNLLKQELARTLQPGCKWISSMDIHPSGDHVLIGSYDRRVSWFDLDLSPRPYKTLRHHSAAVRSVAYAGRSGYPLFATASDDGSVQIFHGQVYADLLQNPLLVPVKRLKGAHVVKEGLGVLSCMWHPSQPWLFTTGADGVAKMWC